MLFSSNSICIQKLTVGHCQCYTLPFIKFFFICVGVPKWLFHHVCHFCFILCVLFCFVFSQVTQARLGCLELLAVLCPDPPSIIYFLINHFRLYRLNNGILCKEERL